MCRKVSLDITSTSGLPRTLRALAMKTCASWKNHFQYHRREGGDLVESLRSVGSNPNTPESIQKKDVLVGSSRYHRKK